MATTTITINAVDPLGFKKVLAEERARFLEAQDSDFKRTLAKANEDAAIRAGLTVEQLQDMDADHEIHALCYRSSDDVFTMHSFHPISKEWYEWTANREVFPTAQHVIDWYDLQFKKYDDSKQDRS